MRNWKPYIADVVAGMVADHVAQALVICLAPQNSRTSVGLYRAALGHGLPFTFEFIQSWHDHPLLIKAFAEKLNRGREDASRELGTELPVIFTAHSVPQRTIAEGDPYEKQSRETAALVAREVPLSPDAWKFAFQSQGMSGGAWLRPAGEDTTLELWKAGYRGGFVQPVARLCAPAEVSYAIDICLRHSA